MTAQALSRHHAPVDVLALVRNASGERQAGAEICAIGVREGICLALVPIQLCLRLRGTLVERHDQGLRVDGTYGIHLDGQILLDRPGLGRLGGKVPQRLPTRMGDSVYPLVGPPLLTHRPAADQSLVLKAAKFGIELLGQRVPEVGDGGIKPFGQVVAGYVPVEQDCENGVSKCHACLTNIYKDCSMRFFE